MHVTHINGNHFFVLFSFAKLLYFDVKDLIPKSDVLKPRILLI